MSSRGKIGHPRPKPEYLVKPYTVIPNCRPRRTADFPLTNRDLVELITHYRQQGPRYQKQYKEVRRTRRAPGHMKRMALCRFADELQRYSRQHDDAATMFAALGPERIYCPNNMQLCGNTCIPRLSRRGRPVKCKKF